MATEMFLDLGLGFKNNLFLEMSSRQKNGRMSSSKFNIAE
jgi:hypothetical protein